MAFSASKYHTNTLYGGPRIIPTQRLFLTQQTTWINAVKNKHFETWPGLTTEAIKKYLPNNSKITVKGHLRGSYQNTQPTHIRYNKPNKPLNEKIAFIQIITKK